MVAVPGPRVRREPREDDIRLEDADGPHHLGENPVVVPQAQGFLRRLGEAEIHRRREELLGTIDAPRGQQLLGPDGREAIAQLVADEVLAAASPGDGEVGRAQVAAPGEGGKHGGVLVIRVGGDVEDTAHSLESVELFLQLRGVPHRNLGLEPRHQRGP